MLSTGPGRKRRRDLWSHFRYIDVEKKTLCLILVEGKECGHEVAGKNTKNLNKHIAVHHKDIVLS